MQTSDSRSVADKTGATSARDVLLGEGAALALTSGRSVWGGDSMHIAPGGTPCSYSLSTAMSTEE